MLLKVLTLLATLASIIQGIDVVLRYRAVQSPNGIHHIDGRLTFGVLVVLLTVSLAIIGWNVKPSIVFVDKPIYVDKPIPCLPTQTGSAITFGNNSTATSGNGNHVNSPIKKGK